METLQIINSLIDNGIIELAVALLGIFGAKWMHTAAQTQKVQNFKQQYGAIYNVAEGLVKAAEHKANSDADNLQKSDRYEYVSDKLTSFINNEMKLYGIQLPVTQTMIDAFINQAVAQMNIEKKPETPVEVNVEKPEKVYMRPNLPIRRGGIR